MNALILSNPILDETLRGQLTAHVTTRRRRRAVRAVGWALVFVLFWTTNWATVDRWVPLPAPARLALLVVEVSAVVFVVSRPVWQLFHRTVHWTAAAEDLERERPALAERLQTVVTQSLTPADQRGSHDMLRRISDGLKTDFDRWRHQPGRRVDRSHLLPWVVVGALLILVPLLPRPDPADARKLLARQLLPLAAVSPVTTTRIHLQPVPPEVVEGTPLRIVAEVDRGGDPVIQFRRDGGTATSARMARAQEGTYAYAVPSADHDLEFQIVSGDASTPPAVIKVLRRPAIERISVNYTFPPYLRRPPASTEQISGGIEAPIGTHCTVTITPIEPIRSASIELSGGVGPVVVPATPLPSGKWSTTFDVVSDGRYTIRMRSGQGLSVVSPSYPIVALKDPPPTVAFLTAETNLRISPAGTIALPFLAADNDGPPTVTATMQQRSGPAVSMPITRVREDERSLNGFVRLDTNGRDVKVGDVISIGLTAADSAGARAVAKTIRFLVSPSSTDVLAGRRRAGIERFVSASETLASRLAAARDALDSGATTTNPTERLIVAVSPRISESAEAASTCVRALLAAIAWVPDADAGDVFAGLADRAQLLAATLAKFNEDMESTSLEVARTILRDSELAAAELRHAADDLRSRERSLEALAIESSLRAARRERRSRAPDPQPVSKSAAAFAEVTEALDHKLAECLTGIGLMKSEPDLEGRLRQTVTAADARLRRYARSDLPAAARRWGARATPGDVSTLAPRLLLASQAQLLRPDGNPMRAHDLRLAAAAARRIDAGALAGEPADVRERFASTVATLLDHRDDGDKEAVKALLNRWAGDASDARNTTPTSAPARTPWPRDALASSDFEDTTDLPEPSVFSGTLTRPSEDARRDLTSDGDLRSALDIYFGALKRSSPGGN